ncbi:MAG: anthranilate synthase component I [Candidatus Bathyarchaeota archaeon]|nr:anthranilate synthase component I [Candidatus Bathyarchaeota archaeon]MDH5713774.1 anthranilate synthase component I [Candidatus Bathyarchaeota archaeon]
MFLRIYRCHEYVYLLESMEGPKKLAQYSFLGFDPQLTIRAKGIEMTLQNRDSEEMRMEVDDPLDAVERIVGERECSYERHRFIGGAVGFISYDAVRYWERLPDIAVDDLDFPDVEVGIFDDGIVFDHGRGEVFYYYRDKNRFDELKNLMKEPADPETLSFTCPKMNIEKERYEESVRRAKEYIASGDIFQVVLSKRYEFDVKGDLTSFYLALRRINPSPYMYFLKMGDRQIVGSSPEMLVRVDNRVVETFPIAGTRPRVDDENRNRAFARELLADPKERAEHVMLVDLARNDVGRVSQFGSVHVPEFMEVHQYSHVQHIVSRVVGKLRDECNCYDALRAVFPAGTVSGAPKVRAMEIIEESEPTKRGPYAGAVGYFSYNRNADFAITIRTLVANGRKCYIQVGAGIVADSVPEREWFETEHKAKALVKALELSEEI